MTLQEKQGRIDSIDNDIARIQQLSQSLKNQVKDLKKENEQYKVMSEQLSNVYDNLDSIFDKIDRGEQYFIKGYKR